MDTIRFSAAPSRPVGALIRSWLRRDGRPARPPEPDWDDTAPAVWSSLPGEDSPAVYGSDGTPPAPASDE